MFFEISFRGVGTREARWFWISKQSAKFQNTSLSGNPQKKIIVETVADNDWPDLTAQTYYLASRPSMSSRDVCLPIILTALAVADKVVRSRFSYVPEPRSLRVAPSGPTILTETPRSLPT